MPVSRLDNGGGDARGLCRKIPSILPRQQNLPLHPASLNLIHVSVKLRKQRNKCGNYVCALAWRGLCVNKFIHSVIWNIYIAPPQDNYSEGFPTPERLNKAVLDENKRRWRGSIKNAKFRRKAVPGWRAPHEESADLLSGGTCKREKKETVCK